MKTKKYYLILVAVTSILCVPTLGQVELPRPEEQGLIGQANPALTGIEDLNFLIVHLGPEPNGVDLSQELLTKAYRKLKGAGLNVHIFSPFPRPELRICINTLKFADSQIYVFRIQISLARAVYLAKDSSWSIKADVWKTEPVMQAVSAENMPAIATSVVLEQVEAFICAYVVANPPDKQPADAKTSDTVSQTAQRQQAKPAAKSPVAKYNYVASKNSKVFHKPECSSAKRILPKNLVGYNSRDEALKAGKRPCKICKP